MKHFKLGSVKAFILNNLISNRSIQIPKLIILTLFLCLLALPTAKECYSQDNQHLVEVSVYWVKETIACAPNGYSSNYAVDAEGKKCAELNKDLLGEFGETVASKVPPKFIPLGYIGELVDDYRKKCTLTEPCKDPNDRYAVILVFKFHIQNPQGTKVSLERRIPESLLAYFTEDKKQGKYYVEHQLDNGGHWINHQRADLFLPGYKVQWILKADNYSWTLGTQ